MKSPAVLSMVSPLPHGFEPMGQIPMMISEFLVGYGIRVGSGHIYQSLRYLWYLKTLDCSNISFIAAAVITVFVVRHLTKSAS